MGRSKVISFQKTQGNLLISGRIYHLTVNLTSNLAVDVYKYWHHTFIYHSENSKNLLAQ